MHWTLTLSQDLQVFMSQHRLLPTPSLLLLPCPYLSIGLGYLGGMKNQMQNTVEPMPKFFTGLDLCFFFLCVCVCVCVCVCFVGKLEGGEKKMQISGEPMPIFFLLFNVQSQAPPSLLLVLAKLMYVLDD